jgi:hypothetical protein
MEWTKCSDLLPSHKSPFIGTDGDIIFTAYYVEDCDQYKVGGWESCYYCGGSSNVSFFEKDISTKKITHWMPLPDAPKE